MKKSVLILFTLLIVYSCNNNRPTKIPKSYIIDFSWGTNWDNQNIKHARIFRMQDSMTILTANTKDSILNFKRYAIDRVISDSIFTSLYFNSKRI